ncbi:MAG: MFS transporter [Spirochaetaceae bacterium]|nr:MFS transporter [Spirochaetaceae bacterium]
MNRKPFLWTLRYSLINITYFAAFCTIHAYAAVYLLANGFSNTQVGILLAVANIVSAVFQPLIAGVIDKPGPLTNRRFILISVLIIFAGSLLLLFFNKSKAFIFAIYALIYMIQFSYQPVVLALNFEYQKAGCPIYFGLARGLGSASFAVTSAFIGGMVAKQGVNVLLWVNIITMVLSAVIVFTFKKPEETGAGASAVSEPAKTQVAASNDTATTAHNKISDFAKTYPAFMLFLVGTICFFFAHNMINDFMIQIIRGLGGGEKELGYSNFLQAILELPVMALIGFVLKKIASRKLLVFSGAAFFIKMIILMAAGNMAMYYFSQSFQLFAYAVFVPAAAYYVSETMEELDQVKGQAYITSAITIGGVFSNLISGVILDNLGINPMLLTGTTVCGLGVVIAFIAMKKLPHNTQKAVKVEATENQPEIWDLYDRNGNRTGETFVRKPGNYKDIPDGRYHLGVDILALHEDGTYLLTKRSDDKDVYPGFWEASAGGAAKSGEEPLEAATRELLEETGLTADSMELVNVLFKDGGSHAMFYSYLAHVSGDKNRVTLQEGETTAFKWVDRQGFLEYVDSDKAIVSHNQRFEKYIQSIR